MEENGLTDFLVLLREDPRHLNRLRDYLESNQNSQGGCPVTWRTIEALNSILTVYSSQETPETDTLDLLLDSFYFLAMNNEDSRVWSNFGFELGVICVKILSAIEHTDKFDVLFCKLLRIINVICEHVPDVWKTIARQILNVFINKKLSFDYFETVLKLYNDTLKNIDGEILNQFSLENLHLLQTLSMFISKVGDFEVQMSITELIFLHLGNDKNTILNWFNQAKEETRKLIQTLPFADFEGDCRLFLNSLNEHRVGFERKVYSIGCQAVSFGGCLIKPPPERKLIWVDANKGSERLGINCSDFQRNVQKIIYIRFPDIRTVLIERGKSQGCHSLTIRAKSLKEINEDAKNDDILCEALEQDNMLGRILNFVHFLENVTRNEHKAEKSGKTSISKDSLFIDRTFMEKKLTTPESKKELQDNEISSSLKPGLVSATDCLTPDILILKEKPGWVKPKPEKSSLEIPNTQEKTLPPPVSPPQDSEKRNYVLETQEMTPNSFVKSLNKHIGMNSPLEEDKSLEKKNHKLFRCSDQIFKIFDTEQPQKPDFLFCENKENNSPDKEATDDEKGSPKEAPGRVLRERKKPRVDPEQLFNAESEGYFKQSPNAKAKKPSLPRLKRNKATKKRSTKVTAKAALEKEPIKPRKSKTPKIPPPVSVEKKEEPTSRPSLLDPNSYTFQRWLQPTTSDRSNFWLKKLETTKKQRQSAHVFDYSDDSDSEMNTEVKKKRKKGASSRNTAKKAPPQTSDITSETQKEQEELPKNEELLFQPFLNEPEQEKPVTSRKKLFSPETPKEETHTSKPEPTTVTLLKNITEFISDASGGLDVIKYGEPECDSLSPSESSQESCSEWETDSEEERGSDVEEEPILNHKRDTPESDTSTSETLARRPRVKKPKTDQSDDTQQALRERMETVMKSAKERDEEQRRQITDVLENTTEEFLSTLRKKEGEKLVSYLRNVEDALSTFEEVNDLRERAKRMHRVTVYFQAGCALSEFCDSMEAQITSVKNALKELNINPITSEGEMQQFRSRLKEVIESKTEISFRKDVESHRRLLLEWISQLH